MILSLDVYRVNKMLLALNEDKYELLVLNII